MQVVIDFFQAFIIVPLTLLPIINPLGTAPIFTATAGGNPLVTQRLARQVAINGWIVLIVSMLVGTYVLELFGISLPIVRIGGGLLVAATGWRPRSAPPWRKPSPPAAASTRPSRSCAARC